MLTVQSSSGIYVAAQYDGTNGADIVAALGASNQAESGGTLSFIAFRKRGPLLTSGHAFNVPTGYWVIWADLDVPYVVDVLDSAEYADQYVETAPATSKVSKSGDTMTGTLTINADLAVSGATTANYENFSGDIMRLLTTAVSTGVVSGGEVTVNADPSKIDIAALAGWIIDYNSSAQISPTNPTITYVNVPAQIGITPSFTPATWFLIDSAGTLIQQNIRPTPAQRRQNLAIGSTLVVGGVVIADQTIPVIPSQGWNQAADLMDAMGAFSTSGNQLTPNGANLSFDKSVGGVFFRGFNQIPDHLNPHNSVLSAQTPVQFRHITAVPGAPAIVGTLLDVGHYDPNGSGVITPVPGPAGTSTNFRVWAAPNNDVTAQIFVQYGQSTYSAPNVARNGISSGTFVPNPIASTAALLGWISVAFDATDLSNAAQAIFTRAPKFATP